MDETGWNEHARQTAATKGAIIESNKPTQNRRSRRPRNAGRGDNLTHQQLHREQRSPVHLNNPFAVTIPTLPRMFSWQTPYGGWLSDKEYGRLHGRCHTRAAAASLRRHQFHEGVTTAAPIPTSRSFRECPVDLLIVMVTGRKRINQLRCRI